MLSLLKQLGVVALEQSSESVEIGRGEQDPHTEGEMAEVRQTQTTEAHMPVPEGVACGGFGSDSVAPPKGHSGVALVWLWRPVVEGVARPRYPPG
jgi:hypothetical protein